ncbi:hypothetical protein ABAC460_02460 [Asticcacaulis sp. AC460]|uniref:hypothetical protein n=1 Tax=Asticcacaulis sp. AC460 TaxID=1282360 RepID=UPI0003C3DB6F|nr:hypothetical protein [Asticcacaulis sp. AC460]ESQ92711.1 hypothetical protein ABAC460_02460 [Asticcacaulis sp. AC460]
MDIILSAFRAHPIGLMVAGLFLLTTVWANWPMNWKRQKARFIERLGLTQDEADRVFLPTRDVVTQGVQKTVALSMSLVCLLYILGCLFPGSPHGAILTTVMLGALVWFLVVGGGLQIFRARRLRQIGRLRFVGDPNRFSKGAWAVFDVEKQLGAQILMRLIGFKLMVVGLVLGYFAFTGGRLGWIETLKGLG